MLLNYHRHRRTTERSDRVPWVLLLPHVITVHRMNVKGTVTDMYSTGNCVNVVPVFPPVGAREYLSEVLLCLPYFPHDLHLNNGNSGSKPSNNKIQRQENRQMGAKGGTMEHNGSIF